MPLFEAPIFKNYPLVSGTLTDETELPLYLKEPPARMLQTHSSNCRVVHEPGLFEETDALITNTARLPIIVRHADCQPCIIFDIEKKWLANIHAGWRGLKEGIYSQALQILINQKGCDPKNLIASIGPSLSQQKAQYIDGETLFPSHFQAYHIQHHYDLKSVAKEELLSWGIPENQIEISPLCTATDSRFHSWRRDKTDKRNVTFCYLL